MRCREAGLTLYDPAAAEDTAAFGIIKHAGLSGADAFFWGEKLDFACVRASGAQDRFAGGARRADPHGDPALRCGLEWFIAQPVDFGEGHDARCEGFFWANDDAFVVHIKLYNIEWIGQAADPKAAALADCVVNDTCVRAKDVAVHVDDFARLGRTRAQFLDHGGIITIWHKADVLAVRLVGDFEAVFLGQSAGCVFGGEVTQREAQILKLLWRC